MERILQRWYDMIAIRSVNGHETAMADYVANVLRELGMEPHYSYFEEDTARQRPSVWSVLGADLRDHEKEREFFADCSSAIWTRWMCPTAGRQTPLFPRRSTARSMAVAPWT